MYDEPTLNSILKVIKDRIVILRQKKSLCITPRHAIQREEIGGRIEELEDLWKKLEELGNEF